MFSSQESPLPSLIAFALGVALVWLTGAPLVAQDADKAKILDLTSTNRFILAARFGKIYTFEDNRNAEAELFLDLENLCKSDRNSNHVLLNHRICSRDSQ